MEPVNCPECEKEISAEATTCPNCDCPIEGIPEAEPEPEPGDELQFPDLPPNLSIGEQLANWKGDAYFSGEFIKDENVVYKIKQRAVQIIMHTEGIAINSATYIPYMKLHFKQIINAKKATAEELIGTDKTDIGQAVVDGLLMGPVQAIVNGMTGLSKEKAKNTTYLVINYWDIESKRAQTLLLRSEKSDIGLYVARLTKEKEESKEIPVTVVKEKEEEIGCTGEAIVFLLLAGAVCYLLS